MVSSSRTIVFEHLPSESPSATLRVPCLDDNCTTRIKKPITTAKDFTHLHAEKSTKLEAVAVSKNIEFPTPSTPIRHLFKTPITVTIGPLHHPFALHLEALLACSPFFAAAFNPHYAFREALTSTLHLAEINVVDFEYFTQWLYRRSLEHESLDGPHPAYFRLIKLWKVADWLQVSTCKNAIIDEIAKIADATNSVPTPDDTRAIFDENVEGDMAQLERLTLDLFVWKKTGHLISTHPDSWDERFLRMLVCRLKEKDGEGIAPWLDRRTRCKRFHVHDQWAPACDGLGEDKGEDGEVTTTVKGRGSRKRRSAAPSPG